MHHEADPVPDQNTPALPGRVLVIIRCACPAYFDLLLSFFDPGAQQLLDLVLLEVILVLV